MKHIEFVRAYLVDVLPHLQKSFQSVVDVHADALSTLQDYLTAVDASVQRLQMQHVVTSFLAAIKVQICCTWTANNPVRLLSIPS